MEILQLYKHLNTLQDGVNKTTPVQRSNYTVLNPVLGNLMIYMGLKINNLLTCGLTLFVSGCIIGIITSDLQAFAFTPEKKPFS